MKKIYLTAAAVATLSLSLSAGINSPRADGHISRCEAFMQEQNYQAALDQLRPLQESALTPAENRKVKFMRAKALYGAGDYAGAAVAFHAFIADFPEGIERQSALKGLGDCAFASGRYSEALKLYAAVAPEGLAGSENAEFNFRRAYCAMRQGNTELAREGFAKASEDASTRQGSLFYLGVIAFSEKEYSEARRYFKGLNTSASPGNMAEYYIAQIDFAESEWHKAASAAMHVLRQPQLDAEMQAEMLRVAGESLCRSGNSSEGIKYLRRYLSATTAPAPSALYLVGVDDYTRGDYAEALERLRLVTDDSGVSEALSQSAYLYIGQSLLHQGDNAAALLAFGKAARSEADADVREAAFYNYAVARLRGASVPFASSADNFEKFLRLYPSGPYSDRVREYLVSGYVADNDYSRALERLEGINNPSDKILAAKQQILYALGSSSYAEGKTSQAMQYLDEAATLARHNRATAAEVTLLQAETLMAEGNTADAVLKFRKYLDSAAKDAANRPAALYGLGYALFSQKRYPEASDAFNRALQSDLSTEARADVLNRLGDIAYYSTDFSSAADFYRRAYSTAPDAGDYAAFNVALMKGYARDYQGKLDALQEFRSEFPSSALIPDALLETTQAQISLGHNSEAVDTYRRLIAEYPLTAQGRRGYLQMALTLLDMGRREEAITAYRDVISNYPTSEEAVQASSLLKNLYAADGRAAEYLDFMASVNNAPTVSEEEAHRLRYESAVANLDKAILDNHGESLRLASEMLEQYPDSRGAETALALLAQEDYDQGRMPEALSRWQQLERKASDAAIMSKARQGIMRAARDMGDYVLAGSSADAILSSSAVSTAAAAEARFTRAVALDAEDKTDEAITCWLELAADPSGLYGAKSAVYAAEALLEQGKTQQARKTAQDLTSSGSSQSYWVARGFIVLADCYAAQGKKFEAKEYLEALRDNYPGSETDITTMIETRLAEL